MRLAFWRGNTSCRHHWHELGYTTGKVCQAIPNTDEYALCCQCWDVDRICGTCGERDSVRQYGSESHVIRRSTGERVRPHATLPPPGRPNPWP